MAKLETNTSYDEHAWLCECGNGFLRVTSEDWGESYIVIEHYSCSPTFRSRIKDAINILRGKPHVSDEVLLGRAQIESLLQWLYDNSGLKHSREKILDTETDLQPLLETLERKINEAEAEN